MKNNCRLLNNKERIMSEDIRKILEDTRKERAQDIMDVEWNEERLKQGEAILKELAIYSSLSSIDINLLAKRARDYFNPEFKMVDVW
tara:strand:+ start:571 stop:831 length:261 start_codon:yes stop_codon:yes gene_type:complete